MDASSGYNESFIFSPSSRSADPIPAPDKDDEGGAFFDASQGDEPEEQWRAPTAVGGQSFLAVPAEDPLVRHTEHSNAGSDIGSGFTVDEVDVPDVTGGHLQVGKVPENAILPGLTPAEEKPSGAEESLSTVGNDMVVSQNVHEVESADALTHADEPSACAFGQTGRVIQLAGTSKVVAPAASAVAAGELLPARSHISEEPTATEGLAGFTAAAGPDDTTRNASSDPAQFTGSGAASVSADGPVLVAPVSTGPSADEAADVEKQALADSTGRVVTSSIEEASEDVLAGGVRATESAALESSSPIGEEQQQSAAATGATAPASAAGSACAAEDMSASHSDISNSVYERWSSSFASVDVADIEEAVGSVHSVRQQLQQEVVSLRSLLSAVEAAESDAVTAEGAVGSAGQADLAEADRIASDLRWFRDVLERRAAELWGESSMLSDEAAALRRGLGQLRGRFEAVKARLGDARTELEARMERAEERMRDARGRREAVEAMAEKTKAEAQGEMEQALADERRIEERERECGELARQLEARRVDVDALVGQLASLEVQVEEIVGRGKGSEEGVEGDGVIVHAPVGMTASGVGFSNEEGGVGDDEPGNGQSGGDARTGMGAVGMKQRQQESSNLEGLEATQDESTADVADATAAEGIPQPAASSSASQQQIGAPSLVQVPASPSPSEAISDIDSVGLRGLEDLRQLDATSASTHSDITDMYASAASIQPATAATVASLLDEGGVAGDGGVASAGAEGHEVQREYCHVDAESEDRFDAHMRMMTELMMQGGDGTDPNPHGGNHGAPAHAFAVQHRDPPSLNGSAVMEVVDEDGWGVVIDAAHAMSASNISGHSSFSVNAGSSPRAIGE